MTIFCFIYRKMLIDFLEHISFLQLWTALSIWAVSPGHTGWLSTWAAWLLVEFWKSLGDRTSSCNLSCEGLQVLSYFYLNQVASFVIVYVALPLYHPSTLNLSINYLLVFFLDGLVLWDCGRWKFQWRKT